VSRTFAARVNALLPKTEQRRLLAAMELTPSGTAYGPSRDAERRTTFKGISFTPPAIVRQRAVEGLELVAQGHKGGTAIGYGRAIQVATKATISPRDVLRMRDYFRRHAVDLQSAGAKRGEVTPGVVAWLLWGGTEGMTWANKTAAAMDAAQSRRNPRRNPSVPPRLLRFVPEDEVIATWASLYAEGKHKGYGGPDLGQHRGKSAMWAEVAIPHDLYNADWNTDPTPPEELLSADQLARARRYAAQATMLPPGMATFTGRGKAPRAYVSDGNHRAFAAYLRGEPTARFFMAMPDYQRFAERHGLPLPNPGEKARRSQPALWEEVVRKVTAGSKGGKPGQWSARKAQLAVALYKAAGGGYVGAKSPKNSLARWTRERWGTKSGRSSLATGERYLPAAALAALSDAEYAATTRAKRAGLARGEQFTPQPPGIAAKTRRYRK